VDSVQVFSRRSFLQATAVLGAALTVEASRAALSLVVADSRRTTKLERWLRSRGIKPAHLARECGYSRQHVFRVRMGRIDPSRQCIASITAACRRLSGENVHATQLFELD
jgi:AraC-like DNA-binding protein